MTKIAIAFAWYAAVLTAQTFSFQQAGSFTAPGSSPAPGEVWQSQWISGRPYSATVVTRTVQVLPGQKPLSMYNTETGVVYRDAQGRTRRETLAQAANSQTSQVTIVDPVAGVQYDFRPPVPGGRGNGIGRYTVQNLSPALLANETKPPGPSPYQLALQQDGPRHKKQKDGSEARPLQRTVEDLGTHTVNGVAAQGVRVTTTIPAGSIGNDADIPVVTERWVSPDLQVLVKSVYSDPRFGTTTYELTDIQRTSPDPSLFQVPPGYESRPSGKSRGGDDHGFPWLPVKK